MQEWVLALLTWFDQEQRSMPWRGLKDPYKILVSEIMLQQTRVDQATPFYLRFIARFPCIQDLANAPWEEVLEVWNGLGYYRRGKFLHQCAKIITQASTLCYPDSFDAWLRLPGIGRYTAGAVMSIAFNKPCPAVDGNVARVMSRFLGIMEDISKDSTKLSIENLLEKEYPLDRCGDFAQALMELGACVCVPQTPLCQICPLAETCYANSQQMQDTLPYKTKKAPPVKETWGVLLLREDDKIMMISRKKEALLVDFWGLPMIQADTIPNMELEFYQKYQLGIQIQEMLMEISHVFSHRLWYLKVYSAQRIAVQNVFKEDHEDKDTDQPMMVKYADLKHMNVAKPFIKILENMKKRQ
jgi:A/G-specific adenine glycosylase